MNRMKQRLIKKAKGIHKTVLPCGGKSSLSDCFTDDGARLVFWFNTPDQSTHVLMSKQRAARR